MMVSLSGRVSNLRLLILSTFVLALQIGCAPRNSSGDGPVPQFGKFDFQIASGAARLSAVFPLLEIPTGATIPLTGLGNSYIEVGPDFESGGALFVANISLADLLRNPDSFPRVGLPDGRPIPGTRLGSLPGRAVNLPAFGTSLLYSDRDLFGLFLPIDLGNLPVNITTRMRDAEGNIIGMLTAVAKGGASGASGALFLFPIEGTSAQRILLSSLK